jgi:hypothetical protein
MLEFLSGLVSQEEWATAATRRSLGPRVLDVLSTALDVTHERHSHALAAAWLRSSKGHGRKRMSLWTIEKPDQSDAMALLLGNPPNRRGYGAIVDEPLVWQYGHMLHQTSSRRPRWRMERLSMIGR